MDGSKHKQGMDVLEPNLALLKGEKKVAVGRLREELVAFKSGLLSLDPNRLYSDIQKLKLPFWNLATAAENLREQLFGWKKNLLVKCGMGGGLFWRDMWYVNYSQRRCSSGWIDGFVFFWIGNFSKYQNHILYKYILPKVLNSSVPAVQWGRAEW